MTVLPFIARVAFLLKRSARQKQDSKKFEGGRTHHDEAVSVKLSVTTLGILQECLRHAYILRARNVVRRKSTTPYSVPSRVVRTNAQKTDASHKSSIVGLRESAPNYIECQAHFKSH